MNKDKVWKLNDLEEGKFYGIAVLQSILKDLNLNHSIYTIRDYETWKCLDYKCGKRHNRKVDVCEGFIVKKDREGSVIEKKACRGPVRPPLIKSPRTRGGGKGPGHRRYTIAEIGEIVNIFKQRA